MIKSNQIISINRTLPIIGEVGDVLVEQELGQGKYGKIWRLRDQQNKTKYYVLEHLQDTPDEATVMHLKAALETQAESDFLPQLYDLIQLEDDSVIILGEYLEGLPLSQWVAGQLNQPWESKKEVFIRLLDAVKVVQKQQPNFVLNADNVVITTDNKPILGDAGMLQHPIVDAPSVAHLAPEYHLNESQQDPIRANIFTLGCILYAFVKGDAYWALSGHGKLPYDEMMTTSGTLKDSNIIDTFDTTFEYPKEVVGAIRIATNFRAEKRFGSIDAFQRHFRQETIPEVQSMSNEPVFKQKNAAQQPLQERKTSYRLRKSWVMAMAVLLLAALAFGGFYLLGGNSEKAPELTVDERKDWNRAIEKNTEYYYKKYLDNHPNGEYTALAWDMIDTLYNAPFMTEDLTSTRFTGKYTQSGDRKVFSMRFTEIKPNGSDYDFKCSVNMGSQRKELIGSIDMDSYAVNFEELGDDYPKLSISNGRLYKRQNTIFIESVDVEQYWVLRD